MSKPRFTVGSLFAGIGGFDLGFGRANFEVRWQVENDDYCNRVLAKHWPNVKRYGDIRDVQGRELEPVDVVCGGFPCQDISNAGAANGTPAGLDGDRSGLWSEYLRILGDLRPSFAVVENTPALLVRGLDRVLGDIATIGLDAEWSVIRASDFGAPSQRDRLFIVAYPTGERCEWRWSDATPRRREWPVGDAVESQRLRALGVRMALYPPVPIGVDQRFPNDVDRLRCAGNTVVPQVAEWIALRIYEALTQRGADADPTSRGDVAVPESSLDPNERAKA